MSVVSVKVWSKSRVACSFLYVLASSTTHFQTDTSAPSTSFTHPHLQSHFSNLVVNIELPITVDARSAA
jgi:hypothetical protein